MAIQIINTYMRLTNYINETKANSPITKIITNAIVVYAKRILGIQNADIKIKHKKSTTRTTGHMMLSNTIPKNHVIYVDLTRGYRVMIKDIIHEITHIKQVIKKELSLQGTDIIWKGKVVSNIEDYTNVKFDDHGKLPFEIEAKDNGNLIDDFLKSKEAAELRNSDNETIKMMMEYL